MGSSDTLPPATQQPPAGAGRAHLGRQLRLARLQLALALRHAPQPRIQAVKLAVGLGARGLQRLLRLRQAALPGCGAGRGVRR